MPTIIVESSWFGETSKEVAEIWLKWEKAPDWLKMIWSGNLPDLNSGQRGMTIWKCAEERLGEALTLVRKNMTLYLEVPGYTFSIDVWVDALDAIKLIE